MVCEVNVGVQSFIFEDGQILSVNTFGVEPVIIDFNLSYPGTASDKMLTTTAFCDIGIIPFATDRLADARRIITEVNLMRSVISPDFVEKCNTLYCSCFIRN